MNNRTETAQPQESFGEALWNALKGNVRQYTMIVALLTIWFIFFILTKGVFTSPRNLSNLFLQMCTTGILTGGMLLVMVAGHIDLSVGSVCGTLGAITAYLMAKAHVNPVIAIGVALVCGLLVGMWHGFWVAYRGVPAFIVTLASQIAFRGFTLVVTNGTTIGEFGPNFKSIGQSYIPKIFEGSPIHDFTVLLVFIAIALFNIMNILKRRKRIRNGFAVLHPALEIFKLAFISAAIAVIGFVLANYKGIPYAIVVLLCIVAIFTVLTTRTPFGRHVYAIGGNKEAAKLSGVDTKKTLLGVFMLMGVLSAVGAVVYTARLNAATAAAGNGFELDTIAACIIGGTSTTGGIGTVFGAIIGALVMESLNNGMSLMNIPIMIQYIVKGSILLLAVWVDIATKKK